MIIWLASYPRSGNTLTRLILHGMYGVKTHSMHADAPLARAGISGPLGLILNDKLVPLLPEFRERPWKYFIKTHAVLDRPHHYVEEEDKAIYVLRDGRDTLVSRAHFFADKYLEYKGQFEDTLSRLVRNEIRYRPWSPTVMTWADRPNTVYVHYESLLSFPVLTIGRAMVEGLGVEIPRKDVKIPKFSTLHDIDPTFFRKGKVGGWKEEMSEELQGIFWENNHVGMEYYGYPMAG